MPRKLGKKEGRKRKKDQKKEGRQGLRDQHDSSYIRLTAITGQTSKRKAYGHTQFKIYVYALFVNSDCISKMDHDITHWLVGYKHFESLDHCHHVLCIYFSHFSHPAE